ncbi:unnamed protein product [Leuciscus chuanchicus]
MGLELQKDDERNMGSGKSKRNVTTENPIEPYKGKVEGQIEDRREIQGVESGERERKESEGSKARGSER